MRTITLEEHFTTPKFLEGPGRKRKEQAEKAGGRLAKVFAQLADVGPGRLAEMDAAGIDMQVLSLTSPGAEQSDAAEAVALATEANDFLADVVKGNPARYAGLAVLPTAAPDKAAAELELRVHRQKFVGAVIHGHNRGRYLDNKFFWPILEAAEKLNAPIYLHPTPPPQGVIDISYGGFAPAVTDMFAASGWGWHIETAVHIVRIVLGGVFDRFPKLQFVIGHLGEALPFMLPRLELNGAGGDQAESADQYLSAQQRALHHFRLQFPRRFSRSPPRSRRRPHHVLGRSSLRVDEGGARFSRANSGVRRRPRAHRPRQCGEAVWAVNIAHLQCRSFPRKRGPSAALQLSAAHWIPAFAGMSGHNINAPCAGTPRSGSRAA